MPLTREIVFGGNIEELLVAEVAAVVFDIGLRLPGEGGRGHEALEPSALHVVEEVVDLERGHGQRGRRLRGAELSRSLDQRDGLRREVRLRALVQLDLQPGGHGGGASVSLTKEVK